MKLVLIHAFPLGPWMWKATTPALEASTSAEVVAPTLPGFDGRAVAEGEPDLGVFADSVLAEVEGEFVVGGCSMGGYVVMELMRRASDRIAGVILVDTKAEADAQAASDRRQEIAAGVERDGMSAWVEVLTAPLLGSTTRASDPHLIVEINNRVAHADPKGVAWAQRAMAMRPDSRGTLANWHRPALVIVGAEDELSPVSVAREMTALLPQGELAVIESAGHLAALESPGEVAEAIARWWATSFRREG